MAGHRQTQHRCKSRIRAGLLTVQRVLLSPRYRTWTWTLLLCLALLLFLLVCNIRTFIYVIRLQEWSIYRFACWPSTSQRVDVTSSPDLFISHGFHPTVGIGNLLFMYASLWGIARKNGLTPTISHIKLHDFMELELAPESFFDLNDCGNFVFGMETCCIYDASSEFITSVAPGRNVSLWGYFQSWKYFHPEYQFAIRDQFRFKPNVVTQANAIIDKAIAGSPTFELKTDYRSGNRSRSRTLVGIHIRRGDILIPERVTFGHTVPTKAYYSHALDYLRAKQVVDAVYIVCTNDAEWARANLQLPNMYLVEDQQPEVDLAVLSMTDHLVLSTGTFSFFIGYLSDAQTVIYYSRWPEPGSEFAAMTNLPDFWLPEWIALE
ncbi:putative Galactoside [Hypsibius exemplaris]|uniref:L-Fucosyltransferase n=1 Tax=Hypsibius exemplaris TaxID=2072580 RepID=A0A9X6NBY7_HYPEX|nr:putative Galactoside [Hypsibius exemplaris]